MDENQMNQRDPMANQMASQNPAPAPMSAPLRPQSESDSGRTAQIRRGMPMNKNLMLGIITVLVVLAVIILAVVKLGLFGMSNEVLGKKAVDYINDNGLAGAGQTATLNGVSEESGLVKVNLTIGGSSFDSYITKDGKLLFPQAIKIEDATGQDGNNNQEEQTGTESPDASKVDIAGDAYVGSNTAPALMVFWTDYQCPFCKQTEQQVIAPIVKDYVNTGKLKLVFKEYAFLGPDSFTLAKYSQAVFEAAPAKYYAWHKTIFDNQGQEHSGWATEAKIMELTTQALGAADAQKVNVLVKANDARYQQQAEADKAEGLRFGVTGTPASIIGTKFISGSDSYANFKAAIEAAIAAAGK